MSRLIAGGNHEMEAGGSGQRGKPTNADRLKQARILYDQMHQKGRAPGTRAREPEGEEAGTGPHETHR